MPEYYFAVADMAVDDEGNTFDAYMKVDFPCEASVEDVMKFTVTQMPSLEGLLRPVSVEEYMEATDEDA